MESLDKEIDLLKQGVADDLAMIREGKEGDTGENLKYICLDKKSPKFDRLKILMANLKVLEGKPETSPKKEQPEENTQEETTTTVVKKKFNIQDLATTAK